MKPLEGVRVVDFSELGPGPYFTRCLVELGASVRKIERPPHGDMARVLSPGSFAALNIGKDSSIVDLRDPEQAQEVRGWIAEADLLVEGFRPGAMARRGFGYDAVKQLNPRIIYVSISGYGQDGPHAQEPGHDINYLAAAGFLAYAAQGGLPASEVCPVPISEFCAGQYALSGALAALYRAARTGEGAWLDISIVDCLIHWWNARAAHFRTEHIDSLDAQREDVFCKPAYGVFVSADQRVMGLSGLEEGFFFRLLPALSVKLDVPHASRADRVIHAREINRAIAAAMAALPMDDIIARLKAADVPAVEAIAPADLPLTGHALTRGLFDGDADPLVCRFPVQEMTP